jgi:glucan phosphoethanolaminetransferase (alkaline phosphatase superfamily)
MLRRRAVPFLLFVPVLMVLVVDVSRRGRRIFAFSGFHRATYLAAIVESFVVWGTLLYAASRRRGAFANVLATLFVVGVTLSVGGQRYFHDQYNAYLNVDVSLFATNFMDSVINQLFADIGNYLLAKLPPFAVSLGLVLLARRVVRPRRRRALVASALSPVFLVAAFFVPTQHRQLQASTPDVLYLEAVGGLIRTQLGFTDQSKQLRPRARDSLPVVLTTKPDRNARPNVLFLILESVRADAVCIEHSGDCRKTPYTDAAVPNRFPLLEMRSLDSSTAISLAVLWSGVGPNESREVLHTWPLLFDYARAAGYDTAFWTSQNMMFGNARLWVKNLGVKQFASATDLDPVADLDMGAPEWLLADHVNRHIGELEEPFFAVVQFSNMHYPYLVDHEGAAPFQPWTTSKAPEDNPAFYNYYLNGVHQEDEKVASIVRHVRESPRGARTIIVYTSDHGEAFRDHGQMGHTFSVLDEEIHVPAWIDAPPGMLSDQQEATLRAARTRYAFHPDLTATIADLLGVWDDPAIAKYRTKMLGTSLLRGTNDRALPLTNCAGVWSCAFENWGYMRRNMKLEARAWDPEWHCYDVSRDPLEQRNLGLGACGDLGSLALSTFGRLPGGSRK